MATQLRLTKLGMRTLDVLHVATALELQPRVFVTYDARQVMPAKAAGLRLSKP